jgi:5-aminopentanamidase
MPRVASVQMDVVLNDPFANCNRIILFLESLAKQGVDIAIFPECALTGYCVSSSEEAAKIAIPRSHEVLGRIQDACNQLGMIAVIGFAEQQPDQLVNTAVLLEAGVESRFYVKTHLPELGYDRFVVPGDELPVFDTKHGRIGIQICFDCRSPEASRTLALRGADLIALPTNWPTGAFVSANILCVARAVENKVFVVTANRVGEENGFSFFGMSKIISPMGEILDHADGEEKVLIADLDFDQARTKRIVTKPGVHETTVFKSRRPELYTELVSPVRDSS